MNVRAAQLIEHSRDAVEYIRRAGGHPRLAAVVAAGSAAVAGGTVYAMRHAGRPYADVWNDEQPYRVSTIDDLKDDDAGLVLVQRELLNEWGAFAPRDMEDMHRLVKHAGRLVFVIRFYEDGKLGAPSGVLQTALVEAGGDPERLLAAYPTFDAITSGGSWESAPSMRGDTAILLQITAFGDRSRGVGSRLRDTALYMLPASIKSALTTTPVPEGFSLDSDPESTPATRFHFRGGARPAALARGFKLPSVQRAIWPEGRQSNHNVVFMRYKRLENGDWDGVRRPDFRLHHHAIDLPRGPLPLPSAIRRLRTREPSRTSVAA